MQKALPNSLQIFNKKRTLSGDRHFSETPFLGEGLLAWRAECRIPFFPRTSIRYIRYTPELPLLDN